MLQKLKLSSAAWVFICTMWMACAGNAACIDVKQTDRLYFQGTLSHQIFPGPPNFEDVRKGDAREAAYILTLDARARASIAFSSWRTRPARIRRCRARCAV